MMPATCCLFSVRNVSKRWKVAAAQNAGSSFICPKKNRKFAARVSTKDETYSINHAGAGRIKHPDELNNHLTQQSPLEAGDFVV
jgi:hypothetical protein